MNLDLNKAQREELLEFAQTCVKQLADSQQLVDRLLASNQLLADLAQRALGLADAGPATALAHFVSVVSPIFDHAISVDEWSHVYPANLKNDIFKALGVEQS